MASIENAIKTEGMKQKITEDEYYRMDASKRLDKEDK